MPSWPFEYGQCSQLRTKPGAACIESSNCDSSTFSCLDDNETSETMDIDPQWNGQQTEEADDDCLGDDEELMVLDDEVSDGDDLADAIEMVSLCHV